MSPLDSRIAQESSFQKRLMFVGILIIFLSVLISYDSLGSKYGELSFAMIILMFGLWFLIPGCLFFYRKRTNPNITNLSDLEIDKLMTVLFGISVICTGIGTAFAFFDKIENFLSMLVVFIVLLIFLFLQVKYRKKRRMTMTE